MASSAKWWAPLEYLKYNLIGKTFNKHSHVIFHMFAYHSDSLTMTAMLFHQNTHIT